VTNNNDARWKPEIGDYVNRVLCSKASTSVSDATCTCNSSGISTGIT